MIDTRFTKTVALVVCAAALFVGNVAQAGSITGDGFTVTLSEGGSSLGTAEGIAGASGDDAVLDAFLDDANISGIINWTDEDTFELDFFGSGVQRFLVDLTWSLTDLDFMDAGSPVDIIGVTEVRHEFGWSYNLDFDANSITIVYPDLSVFEAADGEIISFDVLTVPEPAGVLLMMGGVLALQCRRFRR